MHLLGVEICIPHHIEIEYFFRGMEDWMSQSLGRAKPNEVKPVLKNRTRGKRDINT